MEYDYSIDGWALSVIPAVRDDAMERMTAVHRDFIESIVTKLHEPPCTNKIK